MRCCEFFKISSDFKAIFWGQMQIIAQCYVVKIGHDAVDLIAHMYPPIVVQGPKLRA